MRRGRSWPRFRSQGEWNASGGEWLREQHGTKTRRAWRTLHIGTDADTGHIVAATLTGSDAPDAFQVGPLLDQVPGPVAFFTADGAYDWDSVYADVAARHPDAAVVVPPRANAVPSSTAEFAPTQRNRHLQLLRERGRMGGAAKGPARTAHGRAAEGGRPPRATTGAPWSRLTSAASSG